VTPRSVQRLFEAEGTTFSHFMLDQRLARAHRLLNDPRCAGWTVSAITFEVGIGVTSSAPRGRGCQRDPCARQAPPQSQLRPAAQPELEVHEAGRRPISPQNASGARLARRIESDNWQITCHWTYDPLDGSYRNLTRWKGVCVN
jgi:hypothetical protein